MFNGRSYRCPYCGFNNHPLRKLPRSDWEYKDDGTYLPQHMTRHELAGIDEDGVAEELSLIHI